MRLVHLDIFGIGSMRWLQYLVFIVTVFAGLQPVSGQASESSAVSACNSVSDSLELVKLYNATNGPGWTNKTNWLVPGKAIGTWYGIGVNAQGCVTCIDLDGAPGCINVYSNTANNLTGSLPDLNLPELINLSLSNNKITGIIPNFTNLPKLEQLNIINNDLTGSIPDFSSLTNLRGLHLQSNLLTGTIPDFNNLVLLESLSLSGNNLTGNIPNFSKTPNLLYLDLSFNQLSGPIPDFTNIGKLTVLYLDRNQLSGTIPNFINLPELDFLYLYNNRLNGSIPDFNNLPKLSIFIVSQNDLSGNIPNFTNLNSLQNLFLDQNKFTFQNILPSKTSIENRIASNCPNCVYDYAPQDSIFSDTTIISAPGQNLTIDLGIDAGISTNVYKWYKNGAFWQTITGNNKLIFNNLSISDAGDYYVQVTNPAAPQLTLYSRKISLNVACTNVTTTADSGPGSLRAAIICANSNPGPDTIRFNIPGAGPHIISPGSPLPQISGDSTIIDATTQPGWAAGMIVVDGTNVPVPAAIGFDVYSPNGIIKGFQLYGITIRNFKRNGLNVFRCTNITIGAGGKGNVIYANALDNTCTTCHNVVLQECSNGSFKGNTVGLTPAYATPAGISENVGGLGAELNNFTIGGSRSANEGNVFGHCYGMFFWNNTVNSFNPDNITVIGNNVGVTSAETQAGNMRGGLRVSGGISVTVGGGAADLANKFGYITPGESIWIESPIEKADIAVNEFICNDQPLVGLTTPAPVINQVNTVSVTGTATPFSRVEVYKGETCTGKPCQGRKYLGTVQSNSSGNWTLNAPFANAINANDRVTATATTNNISSGFATCVSVSTFPCNTVNDSLELVKLYNATNGPGWNNKWNLNMPMSTWYGVNLIESGCVRRIDLSNNNLTGTVPNLNLPNLEVWDMDNNHLSNSIPNLNLPSLLVLDLDNNQLSGSIPDFNLPRLQYLSLSVNQLNGNIPDFNLPNLVTLFLFQNNLSGNIPDFNLPVLRKLQLDDNDLTGSIPNFVHLTLLQYLHIDDNQLTGNIPNFQMPELISLHLDNNFLSDSLPDFNMPGLIELLVQNNQLSGPFPALTLCPNLTVINGFNNRFTGEIPALNLPKLLVLGLAQNELTGMAAGFNLPKLVQLHLNNNRLSIIPDLSAIPILPDTINWDRGLRVFNNRLTFISILPNINEPSFTYAPQDSIFTDTTIISAPGQNLTIDLGIDAGISTNVYKWYKNGAFWQTITGNNKLVFNNLSANNAGDYYVQVTNPAAPLLTLYSRKISLNVACTNVTTTADSGPGSLRGAISCANSNPGPDTIRFNIPGAGPHIIQPASALPLITTTTVIDATTQPGWSLGKIIIDGSTTPGNVEGLNIAYSKQSAVYGLVIRNFKYGRGLNCYQDTLLTIGAPGKGNAFYRNADNMTFSEHEVTIQECVNVSIQSNIFGLTETLGAPSGDLFDVVGIGLEGRNIQIGGDRNTGEGNRFGATFFGINCYDAPNNGFTAHKYRFEGNDFGIQDTPGLRCNTGIGVIANIDSFYVGDGTYAKRNRFFSQKIGISVFNTNDPCMSIRHNEFFCNDSIPIERLNISTPVVTTATLQGVTGTATPGALVEVYLSNPCTGMPCQGYARIGVATANGAGQWTLLPPYETTVQADLDVTATATFNRRTSAFGNCVPIESATCNPAEDRQHLIEFYNATNGPNWTNKTNWGTAAPLDDWYGINVNSQGCVSCIDLDGNNFECYSWTANPPGNNLQGNLPAVIGAFPALERLHLSGNAGLTGMLPDTFGGLGLLGVFQASQCNFNGPFPASFFELGELFDFDMSNNPLNTNLVSAWGNLSKLESMHLDGCGLFGSIPSEFGAMDSLNALTLAYNNLTGAVPASFQQLTQLQSLELYNNNLEDLPDLSTLPFTVKYAWVSHILGFDENQFTFEDLLPNLPLFNISGLPSYYSPQDSVFHDTILIRSIGQNLDFSLDFDENESSNIYRWFKNGQFQFQVTGNNDLDIPNLNQTHSGVWQVQVTNPALPLLTLYSRKITLVISCSTTVTTTADAGPGAFRESILCANSNPTADTIRFNIPGAGPHIIAPLTNYADITGDYTIIDATTQPGWTLGNIVLDGSNLTDAQEPMLRAWPVSGSPATPNQGFGLYGMTVRNTPGNGVNVTFSRDFIIGAPGKGNLIYNTGMNPSTSGGIGIQIWRCVQGVVQNNIAGVDQNLDSVMNRTGSGIGVWGDSIEIKNNIIGNCSNGVSLFWPGPYPDNNYSNDAGIYGNQIFGCDNGILAVNENTRVKVGSANAADENILTRNSAGIRIDFTSNQVEIARNQFVCNIDGGIYYSDPGAEPPLPVITSGTPTVIKGTAAPGATVRIFLSGDMNCPAAPCQGRLYLGSATTSAAGDWILNAPFANTANQGDAITANATVLGITSEFTTCTTLTASACDPAADRQQLVNFYTATNGPNWNNQANWLTPAPLEDWFGIRTNSQGCVTCIDLDGTDNCLPSGFGNNLSGPLIALNLPFLTSLNLMNGNLTGPLPNMSGLPELNTLFLNGNQLTGGLDSITVLSKLKLLGLSNNQFGPSIPESIKNLDSLVYFDINRNQFTGQIPDVICELPNLNSLWLGFNDFEGAAPACLANLTQLGNIYLNGNHLTQVPDPSNWPNIGNNSQPTVGIATNRLTFDDVIPYILQNFPGIIGLQYAPQDSVYSDTLITRPAGLALTIDLGIDATIPDNVYTWYKNGVLWTPPAGNNINSNKLIFNNLQPGDAGMYWVTITNPRAPDLTLQSRKITLNITPAIASCNPQSDSLELVSFYNTHDGNNWINNNNWLVQGTPIGSWEGVISTTAEGCVTVLNLKDKNIKGDLPDFNLPYLEELSIINSRLQNQIPDFSGMPRLKRLYLTDNELSGQVPNFTMLDSLLVFDADTNQLSGQVPSFNQLPLLWYLDLNNNQLDGIVPGFLNLLQLKYLDLNKNNIGGTIPNLNHLSKLQFLGLAYNKLTGPMPDFTNPDLEFIYLNENDLSGPIPPLAALQYKNQLGIDLNKFTFSGMKAQLDQYTDMSYAPQDSIFADTLIVRSAGQSLTIDLGIDATVPDNNYQWYKNGNQWTPPPGNFSNSNKLEFDILQVSDAGDYWVSVTNQQVAGLTLQSYVIHLQVLPDNCAGLSGISLLPVTQGFCQGSTTSLNAGNWNTYLWNTGATTATLNVAIPGQYRVTITDINGCTAADTITVSQWPRPMVQALSSDPACFNENTGAIVLTISSGTPAYTFNWQDLPGNNDPQNRSGLVAGAYTVTVTDVNQCTGTSSVVLTAPPLLTGQLQSTPTACGSTNSGTLTLVINGGTSPYAYDWADLPGANDPQNRSGLAPGSYTVTITDSKGCTLIRSGVVNATNAPVIIVSPVAAYCAGANGSINLTVTGGSTPYSFNWSPVIAGNPQNPANLTPGNYTVTVTGSDGCSAVTSTQVLNFGQPQQSTVQAFICAGQSYTQGGNSYTVSGVYVDTLTAITGCDSIVQLELSVQSIAITLTANPAQLCIGEPTLLTASVSNCPGCKFQWNTGSVLPPPLNISPQQSENYQVTITSAFNCTATASVYVAVGMPDTLRVDTVICPGENIKFNNQTFKQEGNYTISLLTTLGCDSTIFLKLSVLQSEDFIAEDDIFIRIDGENGIQEWSVIANDTFPAGVKAKFDLIQEPAGGNASVNNDGMLMYTPKSAFSGIDTVVYTLCDDLCGDFCDTAMVLIYIEADLEKLMDLIPNIVAPNGLPLNRLFDPLEALESQGYYYPRNTAALTIVARNGEIIWHKDPYEPWPADQVARFPDGQYQFILKIGNQIQNGPVTIYRD